MGGSTSFEKRWQTTNKAAIVENFKNGVRDGELRRYYLNGNLLMNYILKQEMLKALGKILSKWKIIDEWSNESK